MNIQKKLHSQRQHHYGARKCQARPWLFLTVLCGWAALWVACSPQSNVNPDDLINKPVQAGKVLFREKTCILCHGADGRGKTQMGKAQGARNLRIDDFKQGDSAQQIVYTILHGVPGTSMVSFETSVSPEEAQALAAFIRSLRKASN